METDVTSGPSVRGLMQQTAEAHGGPHALLNVAGGFRFGPAVEEIDEADWDSMMQLNLKSAFLCIKHALPYMKTQQYGRIVSVSARPGLYGAAMLAPYAVSKGGVILLTQSTAAEVKDLGITANAVLPSVVDTPANREAMPDADFSKWVAPEDLAEVMLFLASQEARAVSGAAIPVYHRA
ncbi:MAG: SDR family NAD(P)-dependent oxidoreductase [Dehalococcoidia bacterium]